MNTLPINNISNVSTISLQKLISGYTFVAIVYFFLNSFLLPNGLLYTIILTPFFLLWLYNQKAPVVKITITFFLFSGILFVFHYSNGIYIFEYLKSTLLYFTCVIFCAVIYTFFTRCNYAFEPIVEKLIKLNFYFVLVALASLIMWRSGNIFWYDNGTAALVGTAGRLKLLRTESSVYSLILVPFFLFYFHFFFFGNLNRKRLYYLISISFALILSLSYGTIGGLVISLMLFFLINLIFAQRSRYNRKFIMFFAILLGFVFFLILGPLKNSLIVIRLFNILGGEDSSVNGRSFEAFSLAEEVIRTKSTLVGVGPGQLKLVGLKVFSSFYEYTSNSVIPRVPSAAADTLAVFGYFGLTIRYLTEFILFFTTKVYKSSYRLCLFIFAFIFQFGGGDTADINSYFIWVLAFSNVFPDNYFKKVSITPNNLATSHGRKQ